LRAEFSGEARHVRRLEKVRRWNASRMRRRRGENIILCHSAFAA
jgi:hypothetical protein